MALRSRRQFLRGALIASAGVAAGFGWAVGVEPHWLEWVERAMPIAGLPPALHGRRLMHLSDLHVGPHVDERYLARVLDTAAALRPDLVVATGDYLTYRAGRGERQFRELAGVLAHLPRAPLGTFAVLGNHDYGRAWSQPEIGERVSTMLAAAGVRMLRNARAEVAGLEIVGIDDLWGPRFDPAAALADRDASRPALVLCHNPDACDLDVWGGLRGWILSGHTHGGQVRPPFLPPTLLPVRNPRYAAGEVDLGDGRRLYVSRGIGHLLRVRFRVRPEVTVFTLTDA